MRCIVLAVPVSAIVMVFAFYSLFHWRSRGRPDRDGPYLVAGNGVQIAWVAISVVLVLVLYAWGLVFLKRADSAPAPSAHVLNVDVTGEQWNWNFTYPQYHNAQSSVLEVPLNRPILFTISSIDVVHFFSVPRGRSNRMPSPASLRTSASRPIVRARSSSRAMSCAACSTPTCSQRLSSLRHQRLPHGRASSQAGIRGASVELIRRARLSDRQRQKSIEGRDTLRRVVTIPHARSAFTVMKGVCHVCQA